MSLTNLDGKGIGRYVESTPIGDEFSDYMNLGLESISEALPDLVTSTSSARDAYWGVPANDTEARALQDRGARTIRLDKGYTEQYYANLTAGGSNPGGNIVGGWKPVVGIMPFVELAITAKSIANNSEVALGITSPDRAYTETSDLEGWHHASTNPNRIIPTIPGIYRVTIEGGFAANSTGVRLLRARKNATAGGANNLGWILPMLSPSLANEGTMTFETYLNGSTDYLDISAYQNSGGALNLTCLVRVVYGRPA